MESLISLARELFTEAKNRLLADVAGAIKDNVKAFFDFLVQEIRSGFEFLFAGAYETLRTLKKRTQIV